LTRSLQSVWAVLLVALSTTACHVEETHTRCASRDDCAGDEECYLGFCVLDESAPSESSSSSATRRDAAATSSTRTRPRMQPTMTGREEDDDASARVSMNGTAQGCVRSDDDSGVAEGSCCSDATSCYEGPERTLGVGRCKAGKRECKDGRLGVCEGAVQPRAESCDNEGADDDCDGMADNVRNRGRACTLDAGGQACGKGVYGCIGGKNGLQCVPEAPPPEQCNNKDDDCDSKTDEGFDLMKDEMNCGACGTRCANMQSCCGGACVARGSGPDGCPECSATQACGNGANCCGGSCANLQTDRNNCGACGRACGGRESCCGGTCIDTRSNIMNCGRCGTTCSQGTKPACCGGSCVDLASDERNCGQCGMGCGAVCECVTNNGQSECRGGPFGLCL
jgi:hypothetical protein